MRRSWASLGMCWVFTHASVVAGRAEGTTYTVYFPQSTTYAWINGAAGNQQVGFDNSSPVLWTNLGNGNYSHVVLASAGEAYATAGGLQAGYSSVNGVNHATVWAGSSAGAVDLNGSFVNSYARAIAVNGGGNFEAGYGVTNGSSHAILWAGSGGNYTDLNGSFTVSHAYAIALTGTGSLEAGSASGNSTSGFTHAVLWAGSPGNVTDLNGSFSSSEVNAIAVTGTGSFEAGDASLGNGFSHAVLWAGSPGNYTDLNGSFSSSVANAIAVTGTGSFEAGYAKVGGYSHAILWSGTAASAVDLHPYVTAAFDTITNSVATAVDASGNVYGYVYYVPSGGSTIYTPIEWVATPSPEPSSLLAAAGMIALGLRRHRRSQRYRIIRKSAG